MSELESDSDRSEVSTSSDEAGSQDLKKCSFEYAQIEHQLKQCYKQACEFSNSEKPKRWKRCSTRYELAILWDTLLGEGEETFFKVADANQVTNGTPLTKISYFVLVENRKLSITSLHEKTQTFSTKYVEVTVEYQSYIGTTTRRSILHHKDEPFLNVLLKRHSIFECKVPVKDIEFPGRRKIKNPEMTCSESVRKKLDGMATPYNPREILDSTMPDHHLQRFIYYIDGAIYRKADVSTTKKHLVEVLKQCSQAEPQYPLGLEIRKTFLKSVSKLYDHLLAWDTLHIKPREEVVGQGNLKFLDHVDCYICKPPSDTRRKDIFHDERLQNGENGKYYRFPGRAEKKFCENENVIYLIHCETCDKRYVGKSEKSLADRYKSKKKPHKHFEDEKDHKAIFYILQIVDQKVPLEGVEKLWIHRLTKKDDLNKHRNRMYDDRHLHFTEEFLRLLRLSAEFKEKNIVMDNFTLCAADV